jgi:hypothetical protein
MMAGLILDLIPVPTVQTPALILVPIHAFIPRLPPWLWTGTFLWETAGQPMVIHAGQSITILERYPMVIHEGHLIVIHEGQLIVIHEGQLIVIHEGQLIVIHECQPSRPILLPRDMIRMGLFHLTKPGQFHVALEMNLKCTTIRLADQ